MLLLDALYVNSGGGKVLLDYLVSELEVRGANVFYLFDWRCRGSYGHIPDERKRFLKASLRNRTAFYKRHAAGFDSVLCFGNLAPTVKIGGAKVTTYFHQLFFLAGITPSGGLKSRIVYTLKRSVVKRLNRNTDFVAVQTEYVKQGFCSTYGFPSDRVLVLPFYDIPKCEEPPAKTKPRDFVYVSGGNHHKNHHRLLKAWEMLADKGYRPELGLTVNETAYPELAAEIHRLSQKGINIVNYGFTDPYPLYARYGFLIYPSLLETIGLGMVEAAGWGCRVIASDLPQTYAVMRPSLVFDPFSEESICGAVITALKSDGIPEPEVKIHNSIDELIQLIIYKTGCSRVRHC